MNRREQAAYDKMVADGTRHFLKTLGAVSGTKAIVLTVQPDGYVQFHTSITEPEVVTRHLMRVAAGDREGAVIQ